MVEDILTIPSTLRPCAQYPHVCPRRLPLPAAAAAAVPAFTGPFSLTSIRASITKAVQEAGACDAAECKKRIRQLQLRWHPGEWVRGRAAAPGCCALRCCWMAAVKTTQASHTSSAAALPFGQACHAAARPAVLCVVCSIQGASYAAHTGGSAWSLTADPAPCWPCLPAVCTCRQKPCAAGVCYRGQQDHK